MLPSVSKGNDNFENVMGSVAKVPNKDTKTKRDEWRRCLERVECLLADKWLIGVSFTLDMDTDQNKWTGQFRDKHTTRNSFDCVNDKSKTNNCQNSRVRDCAADENVVGTFLQTPKTYR